MIRLRKILAATDLSTPARRAAERAAMLARASGAKLSLVHALNAGFVAQLRQLLGLDTAVEDALIEQTRDELNALARDLVARHGADVEPMWMQGAVLEELDRAATGMEADLVVLGATGAGVLRHFVPGSTAERLLRKLKQPMLVVKQQGHEPYRRVLVAVDFSPWSAPLIDLARRVAPGAHVVLLNACAVPFEGKLRYGGGVDEMIQNYRKQARQIAAQQLHAMAAAAGLEATNWTPCIRSIDASLAIVEEEREQACDLIVIGKHGRHVAEEWLLGSVTTHVLAESDGDVLVSTSSQPVVQD
ncbi:MAG: universal stress protein [Burkholderiaceae bacterium]|nr:universal stress protein [Burkholderiaceae bacterium]